MNLSHKSFISNIPSNIIKPNSHKIDYGKLKLWLKNCDPEIKKIAGEFFLLTKYISYNKFLKFLLKCVDEMLETLKTNVLQFYLASDDEDYKFKSGFWIIKHIKAYIETYINPYIKKKYEFKLINNIKNIDFNLPIIIADDASYSGSQISNFIEEFGGKTCSIFILIPFISNTAINTITSSFKENEINGELYFIKKNKYIMQPIYEIMDSNKIIKLFKYYSGTNIREYPIYFDHKVADSYSSFPLIYTYGIVANENNKKIINDCKANRIPLKSKFNDLDRIVFLKNCSNDAAFDIHKPACPLQPYKESFIHVSNSHLNKSNSSKRKSYLH